MIILLALSFSGYFLLLYRKFSVNAFFSPLITFSLVMVWEYIFALLNLLRQGTVLLFIFGIISAVYYLYDFIRNKNRILDYRSDIVPLFLFTFISVLFYFSLKGANLHLWDEFTHWGRAVKDLGLYNTLPKSGNSTLRFPDYPPVVSLFHYYVSSFLGFTEGNSYVSMSWLIFSSLWCVLFRAPGVIWNMRRTVLFLVLVIYFFIFAWCESSVHSVLNGNIYLGFPITMESVILTDANMLLMLLLFLLLRKTRELRNLFLFFLIFTILFFSVYVIGLYFEAGFQSLYVDTFLGVYFGSSLLVISYIQKKQNPFNILLLIPVLIILPLIKKAGLFLGIFTIIYALCSLTPLYLQQFRKNRNYSKLIVKTLFLILLFLVPLCSSVSWKSYVNSHSLGRTFSSEIKLPKIIKAFSKSEQSPEERTIINNFFDNFTRLEGMPVTASVVLLLLLSGTAIYLTGSRRKRLFNTFRLSILWLGCIGYILGLLILYIFAFKYEEAVALDSFWRYTKIYFIGIFLVNIHLIIINVRENKQKQRVQTLTLFLIFMFFSAFISTKLFIFSPLPMSSIRRQIQTRSGYALKKVNKESTVYVVCRGSHGMEYYMAEYELMPIRTTGDPGDIGPKFNKNDKFTQNITTKQFKSFILKSDYLLLAGTDRVFWEKYGSFLAEHGADRFSFLYKVEREKNSNFKLTAI